MPRTIIGRTVFLNKYVNRGIFAVVFSMAVFLSAVSEARPADLGLKLLAGWAHAGVESKMPPPIDRLGFGIGFEAWIFRGLGVEADLVYSRKGYHVTWETEDHDFAEISFPVLLKARFFLDGASTLSLSIFGGGAYSLFLTEMDPDFRQHDWGIIAGASLEKRLGGIGLLLEGRYHWGLLYQSDEYMPGRFSFKTRTFYLLAGVRFPL